MCPLVPHRGDSAARPAGPDSGYRSASPRGRDWKLEFPAAPPGREEAADACPSPAQPRYRGPRHASAASGADNARGTTLEGRGNQFLR